VLTTNYNGTGKALLLAEDILIAGIPYYTYDWQNGESANRTINGKTVYRNNYKYSIIRAYLNGKYETEDPQTSNTYKDKGFLQCAFLQSSQDLISVTDVDNSADSTTDAGNNKTKATKYACDNTSDKIFLLSEKEVTNTTYSFGASGTGRFPTDYAKANYAYQNDDSRYGGYWRLRSPIADEANYDHSGDAWYMDIYGSTMNDIVSGSEKGIVPALTISLTSD